MSNRRRRTAAMATRQRQSDDDLVRGRLGRCRPQTLTVGTMTDRGTPDRLDPIADRFKRETSGGRRYITLPFSGARRSNRRCEQDSAAARLFTFDEIDARSHRRRLTLDEWIVCPPPCSSVRVDARQSGAIFPGWNALSETDQIRRAATNVWLLSRPYCTGADSVDACKIWPLPAYIPS